MEQSLKSHPSISQNFMEPEHSLPCSQEPATRHPPKPDRSSPYHPIPRRLILTLSSDLHLSLHSSLSSGFLTKTMHTFLSQAGYVPCPSHLPWLNDSNYIWWSVQFIKLICNFSWLPTISSPFSTLLSNTFSLRIGKWHFEVLTGMTIYLTSVHFGDNAANWGTQLFSITDGYYLKGTIRWQN
jgi:hypothetical protein